MAMSANPMNNRNDQALDRKIRAAYDAMDPSAEAEARMLAALKAFQAAGGADDPTSKDVGHDAASDEAGAFTPVKAARKKTAPWKVVLPAAACLALAAIGVGVWAGQPNATEQAAPEASTTANTAASAASDAKDTGADAIQAPSGENAMAADVEEAPAVEGDGGDFHGIDPGGFNTEEYGAIEETGFVSTATAPLSTVSADVDTASYANLRRMLASGRARDSIPAGSVRIEEMLNYFDYGYAKPAGDERFGMTAAVGACPWNPNTQLLVLGFATPEEVQDKPANLVFLIDVSGSMNSTEKLALLQDSFATLLDHLDGNDRVSIVTYSGREEVVLEGAAVVTTGRLVAPQEGIIDIPECVRPVLSLLRKEDRSLEGFHKVPDINEYYKMKERMKVIPNNNDEQKDESLLDDLKERLKPIFYNHDENIKLFLKTIRGMKQNDITDLVNKWVSERLISNFGYSRKGVLWTILHDAGLYKRSKQNWCRRVY